MYVEPPQAFLTCGACGPEYVNSTTGYFFDGSKSGGRIIIASISNPSRVFTRINSAFPSLYCPSAATLFSSTARTSVPSELYRRTCVGVFMSLQESTKYRACGENVALCVPSDWLRRLRPE